MLKDITWKLKTSKCSNVITFENLYRIINLCGLQNIWSFLIFMTISIHSWLLFTLKACWLAISEEMSLKSIIFLFLSQIPWISFSQFKSSNQHYRKHIYIYSLVIASKPRNIVYIPWLTDERIEKYKVDEYMALYSSVLRNINYIPRLHITEEYSAPPPSACARSHAHIFLS
jgi:hypothetical protein